MLHSPSNSYRGITLLEVIIAIAILSLLAVFAMRPLQTFRDEQVLTSHAERISAFLTEARTLTLASRNAAQYGVHFNASSSRAVLFEGETFSAATSTIRDLSLHPRVFMSEVSLEGGGDDVVFERLTGDTAQEGMVVLQLINNASSTRSIIIEESGTITVRE